VIQERKGNKGAGSTKTKKKKTTQFFALGTILKNGMKGGLKKVFRQKEGETSRGVTRHKKEAKDTEIMYQSRTLKQQHNHGREKKKILWIVM